MTKAEATRALRTRAELMPLVRTIWLVNREGRLLSASDTTPVPELASFLPALDELTDEATAVYPSVWEPPVTFETVTPTPVDVAVLPAASRAMAVKV